MDIKNLNGDVIYRASGASTMGEAFNMAVKEGISLRGADFRFADLRCAYFRGVNLTDVDFTGARFSWSV